MNQKPGFKIDNSKLARLVAKAQKGNDKATEEVVNMISGYLYYYSLTLLGDDDKARDAVQDILLSMLQKLNTLENPKAFLGWMKTMTAHYCHNKVTRAKTQYSLDEMIETEDLSEQICPSKPLETEETCALVREAVNALPVLLRESVMMHYFNQMSVREIAQTLEINENTVKSRLHSARQSMKKYLEKYGGAALASCLVPPMKLITYSLIHEAESKQGILIPFTTPSGAVKVASLNAAAASAVPVKVAAIACAALVGIGGAGAAAGVFASQDSDNPPQPTRYHNAYEDTATTAPVWSEVAFTTAPTAAPVYASAPQAQPPTGAAASPQQGAAPGTPAAAAATAATAATQPAVSPTSPVNRTPAVTAPAATSARTPAATTPAATRTPSPSSPSPAPSPVPSTTTAQTSNKRIFIDTSQLFNAEDIICHVWTLDGHDFYTYGSSEEACTQYAGNIYTYDLSALPLADNTEYGLLFSSKGRITDDFHFTTADYGRTLVITPMYFNNNYRYTLSWK